MSIAKRGSCVNELDRIGFLNIHLRDVSRYVCMLFTHLLELAIGDTPLEYQNKHRIRKGICNLTQ
jgi:hypothetical protein